jgi:hypothetical protein
MMAISFMMVAMWKLDSPMLTYNGGSTTIATGSSLGIMRGRAGKGRRVTPDYYFFPIGSWISVMGIWIKGGGRLGHIIVADIDGMIEKNGSNYNIKNKDVLAFHTPQEKKRLGFIYEGLQNWCAASKLPFDENAPIYFMTIPDETTGIDEKIISDLVEDRDKMLVFNEEISDLKILADNLRQELEANAIFSIATTGANNLLGGGQTESRRRRDDDEE